MILIALGANLVSSAGNLADTLHAALATLARQGIEIEDVSAFYKSPAWPDPSDPPFVNAVARLRTDLTQEALLAELHATEATFGRARGTKNAPRTLDLDLLDYNGAIATGRIELPHPRMASRAFVLMPLRDVAPAWRHPVTGKSVDELIAALPVHEIERL